MDHHLHRPPADSVELHNNLSLYAHEEDDSGNGTPCDGDRMGGEAPRVTGGRGPPGRPPDDPSALKGKLGRAHSVWVGRPVKPTHLGIPDFFLFSFFSFFIFFSFHF